MKDPRDLTPPTSWLRDPEKLELMRQAAERALRTNAGRMSPAERREAMRRANVKPLARPLTPGAPIPDNELPPALRGGALEVF